jgi:hypothetical protein
MNQHDTEQFFQLYLRYRHKDQFDFYASREKEYRRAQSQALGMSIGLILLASLAGAFEALPLSWFEHLCLLVAAICPVLATALAGYNALYAFEQQAKLYRDARQNLERILVQTSLIQQGLHSPDFASHIHTYVHEVESILHTESGYWGQLAKTMKPPEI